MPGTASFWFCTVLNLVKREDEHREILQLYYLLYKNNSILYAHQHNTKPHICTREGEYASTASYYTDRAGTAYVYKNLSGSNFTRTNIILSQMPSNGDLYGESVSISGDNYVIGGSHNIVNGLTNAGIVYFGSQ